MCHLFNRSNPRFSLAIFFGGLALALLLLGLGDSELSWAAPQQSPDQQTVPTRFPDETDEPPPAPSPVPETPTRPPADANVNDNPEAVTATPEVGQAPPQADAPPTSLPSHTAQKQTNQPSTQGDSLEQGNAPVAQTPVNEADEAQVSSTPTPTAAIILPPVAVQAEGAQLAASLNPDPGVGVVPGGHEALLWLYALVLGVILMVSGIVLARRA